jgi:polyferredoxin
MRRHTFKGSLRQMTNMVMFYLWIISFLAVNVMLFLFFIKYFCPEPVNTECVKDQTLSEAFGTVCIFTTTFVLFIDGLIFSLD